MIVSARRTKPISSILTWNVYDCVLQDLSRSNDLIDEWHRAFDYHVSIKNPTVSILLTCILREQTYFEMDIERIQVHQQSKPKKKIYAILDSRLERVVASYNFEAVVNYIVRATANVELSS